MFIYGVGREPFYEETHTISINGAGGLILLASNVQPGQRILVANQGSDQTQQCMVVSLIAQPVGRCVAFKFLNPMPPFWRGLEIGNSAGLRNWSEYFIEALIPIIRAETAPALSFEFERSAVRLMPTQHKMLGPVLSSCEDSGAEESGGLNGSMQR